MKVYLYSGGRVVNTMLKEPEILKERSEEILLLNRNDEYESLKREQVDK